MLDLSAVLASPVDGLQKALPPDAPAMPLSAIGSQGWSLLRGDLPFPQAVLKRSALERNARWMRDFLAATGAKLAPHGKTTMSPQLFDLQLEAGAWGITVATAQQFEVCRRFGAKRMLMANQLVGRRSITAVSRALDADPSITFFCIVDSPAGVAHLSETLSAIGAVRPIPVLAELGMAGKRTGARSVEEGLAVARAVAATPNLLLAGVEGYEGLQVSDDPDRDAAIVTRFLEDMAAIARQADAEGLFGTEEVLLTAGGSAYYDIVARTLSAVSLSRPTVTVVRSGCYVTHDSSSYEKFFNQVMKRLPPDHVVEGRLTAALEVWGMVQSVPEPGLAFLTFGKRDCSYDVEMPVPLMWFSPGRHDRPQRIPAGGRITGMNDQHAHFRLPDGFVPAVGDLVAVGISHPCTTFDRWPVMLVVDDEYRVVDAIRTYF